jgi:hypothetical protein
MTTDVCPNDFNILKKEMKSEKYEISSYHTKRLWEKSVWTLQSLSCHVRCLEMESSSKKFHIIEKYMVRFVEELTFNLEHEFKTFTIN